MSSTDFLRDVESEVHYEKVLLLEETESKDFWVIEEVLGIEFRCSMHNFLGIYPWMSCPAYGIEEFPDLLLDSISGVGMIPPADDIINIGVAGESCLSFAVGCEEFIGSSDDDCTEDTAGLTDPEGEN